VTIEPDERRESVNYDHEYRRQCCRERIASLRDDYRRVQAPPRNDSHWRERVGVAQIRSMWERVRRSAEQGAPAYRP
jgi:hypothetical protein